MTVKKDGVTSHTADSDGTVVEPSQLQIPTDPTDRRVVANPKKYDPMLVGYVFPHQFDRDKTPYDFLNNPFDPGRGEKTRGEYASRVWGVRVIDLRTGVNEATLPPLQIWDLGVWWNELKGEPPFEAVDAEEEIVLGHECYITDGQGTPGNYSLNCYLVPEKIAKEANPRHPLLWGVKLTAGLAQVHYVNRQPGTHNPVRHKSFAEPEPVKLTTSTGWPPYTTPAPLSKPVTPTPVKQTLPHDVRFRCAHCGHWFTEGKLIAHNKSGFCPGKEDGGQSDWAVMCDKDCGCMTLDDAAACKPGFPRPQKEVNMSETVEETPDEAPAEETTEDETPAEETPAEVEAPASTEAETATT
jgi:hypothetical protein